MELNPLMTVITVCRNAEATIRDTVESVLHQDYRDIEYIVVDGASTDETLDILRDYEAKFEGRMRWISEPDGGIYDAMNKGIGLATGQIIGIINADDWYEREAVQRVVERFVEAQARDCIITGRLCICSRDGRKLYHEEAGTNIRATVLSGMPVTHPATFVSKGVFERIGLFDLSFRISADYDFFYRAVNSDIAFIPTDADIANMRVGGISSVGLSHDLDRVSEDFRVRKKNAARTAGRYYLRDLCMLLYRRTKRLVFGRFFILKRIDIE